MSVLRIGLSYQRVNDRALTSLFCGDLKRKQHFEGLVNAEWVETVPYAHILSSSSIISTTADT